MYVFLRGCMFSVFLGIYPRVELLGSVVINLGSLPPPQWLSSKEYTSSVGDTGDVGLILGWEDLLERGMATSSNILAWEIPWTEEPGGLQSMGS